MGIEASSIEKDFWICWILRGHFQLPELGQHFTFKGGTSLSKGWGLIERFSEDIDLVIDRGYLGFDGTNSPEGVTGTKERARRVADLMQAAQECVNTSILTALRQSLVVRMPPGLEWELIPDEDDPDWQSLLFRFPSLLDRISYISPMVKLEFGARSDTDPFEAPQIQAYIADIHPKAIPDAVFTVRAVSPTRTFWEKAMLLHEEALREGGAGPKSRLARHYYDLWCLIRHGIGARTSADPDLFQRIAAHCAVYFRKNQQIRDSMVPGSLRIVPRAEHVAAWRRDYEAMREAMFFGEVPDFEEVMVEVRDFQETFNLGHSVVD